MSRYYLLSKESIAAFKQPTESAIDFLGGKKVLIIQSTDKDLTGSTGVIESITDEEIKSFNILIKLDNGGRVFCHLSWLRFIT